MNTKASTALRFLEDHEVFTLGEFMGSVDPAVGERTRYNNLQNALKREQAQRITRGLYASNLGIYRDRVPNVMLVASKASPDAVVSHHSALEAHGVAHTPFRTIYFTSLRRTAPFEFRGYRFMRVSPPRAVGDHDRHDSFVTSVRVGDVLVRVTSRERTLVDCLYRLDLAGGLEELLRSVGGFTTVNAEDVAAYADVLASPTATARVGWLFSVMQPDWHSSLKPVYEMKRHLRRGTYWLEGKDTDTKHNFVSDWRLYVPADLPYQEWLRG